MEENKMDISNITFWMNIGCGILLIALFVLKWVGLLPKASDTGIVTAVFAADAIMTGKVAVSIWLDKIFHTKDSSQEKAK